MKRNIFIILSFFICTELYSETISLIDLMESKIQNNPNWIQLKRDKESNRLNRILIRENYLPYITLGDESANLYTFSNMDDLISQNIVIISALNWWTPLDGTASLGVVDTLSITESEEKNIISHSPSFSFSYTQPFWLTEKIIEPSLYKKSRELYFKKPLIEENIKTLISENKLILQLVTDYLEIKSGQRELKLKNERLVIAEEELKISAFNREKGVSSGSEFWEKQLEVDQLKEGIEEDGELLKYKLRLLYDSFGITENINLDSLVLDDLPELHLIPKGIDISFNPEVKLKQIEMEKSKLESDINRKKYASQITTSFSVSPKYGDRDDISSFQDSFNFTTDNSYIDYSFKVNVLLSGKDIRQEKIERDINSLKINSVTDELNELKQKTTREMELLYKKLDIFNKRVKRRRENLKLAKSLCEEEIKLFDVGRSSEILKNNAKYNLKSKENELKKSEEELYLLRLQIISENGINLKNNILQ